MNLFTYNKDLKDNVKFQWMNEPQEWDIKNGKLKVFAPPLSDFFIDEEGPSYRVSAPFYYFMIGGDFRLTTRVNVDMKYLYDSACLMIMDDEENWAKLCYENWDNRPSIVSVVTKGFSDDCPSFEIDRTSPFLRVVRSSNCFGFHYSLDGEHWKIVRYFNMKTCNTIKVGVASQSPIGKGCHIEFDFLNIELERIKSSKKAT